MSNGVLVVLVVAFSVTWLVMARVALVWPEARRGSLVRTFAAKRSLVLDEEASALAGRLLVAQRRGRYLGAAAGATVTGPAVWLASMGSGTELEANVSVVALVIVPQVVSQIAGSLGAAIAVGRAGPQPASPHRVARLRAAGVDDFLPPLLRWWSPALLIVAGVAVAVAVAVRPDDPYLGPGPLIGAWAFSAAAVLVMELVARRLADAPQPAGSPSALAVHDEVKSDLLSGMVVGGLLSGFICVVVAGDLLPEAGFVVAVAVFGPLLFMEHQRRHRVRERLWSTAAEPEPVG